MKNVRIKAGSISLDAVLNSTETASAIYKSLPISAEASLWGDEIYFSIPVSHELEDGREIVKEGDLGYWPPGQAFCIFFVPTPVSRAGEIRPASAVTIVGKVFSDAAVFKKVASGAKVTIERIHQEV